MTPHLRNWDVIDNGRGIPVGIQMIVGLRIRSRGGPKLVQESTQVLGIGGQLRVEFGNRNVSDLQLLPTLFFVRFEYLIERLFQRRSWSDPVEHQQVFFFASLYLVVSRNREGAILQLLSRQLR
jgi:hypothetical protein